MRAQSLYFKQHGPRPLGGGKNRYAAHILPEIPFKKHSWIFHFHHSGVAHLEYADLARGAEAVLYRPQDAKV